MTKINECGVLPLSLLQALAAAIMRDSDGNTFLNTKAFKNVEQCDCEPAYTCDMQGVNLETFIVQNIFELDDCGHVTLKIGQCDAEIAPR